MDPYIESSTQRSDFNNRFVNVLSEVIADRLPQNYFARLGEDVAAAGTSYSAAVARSRH
jgi:hypothetical protein